MPSEWETKLKESAQAAGLAKKKEQEEMRNKLEAERHMSEIASKKEEANKVKQAADVLQKRLIDAFKQ